jgi:hypothetical protein
MMPRCLLFVPVFCVFVPALRVSAATVLDEVPVRVYDASGLDAATRTAALNVAAATLAPAAPVWWRHCKMPAMAPGCEHGPAPGELVLRIVRSRDASDSRGVRGHLRSATPLPLGDALVDPLTQSGALATIYVDRVRMLAQAAGVPVARLLGHAIAHEIGHLLLASNGHGTDGLMRPVWSSDEVRRSRPGDWLFSRQEVAAIRARRHAAGMDANIVWGTR